jgi:hypothetical protein
MPGLDYHKLQSRDSNRLKLFFDNNNAAFRPIVPGKRFRLLFGPPLAPAKSGGFQSRMR